MLEKFFNDSDFFQMTDIKPDDILKKRYNEIKDRLEKNLDELDNGIKKLERTLVLYSVFGIISIIGLIGFSIYNFIEMYNKYNPNQKIQEEKLENRDNIRNFYSTLIDKPSSNQY